MYHHTNTKKEIVRITMLVITQPWHESPITTQCTLGDLVLPHRFGPLWQSFSDRLSEKRHLVIFAFKKKAETYCSAVELHTEFMEPVLKMGPRDRHQGTKLFHGSQEDPRAPSRCRKTLFFPEGGA